MRKKAIIILSGLVLVTGAFFIWSPKDKNPDTSQAPKPLVIARVPDTLSSSAQAGKALFDNNCAACHGQNASGQDGLAPPLIHKIYEPSIMVTKAFTAL